MDDACPTPAFDPARSRAAPLPETVFKDAMCRLAGGVGVAACWNGETPTGLLVSSIAALSVTPPRVLFCVQKIARSHNALFHARQCSLNLLAEDDRLEADRFSNSARSGERFDPAQWTLDPASPPTSRSALVALTGTIGHRMDAGTHTVFVLNVRDVDVRDAGPLVYFDRGYAGLRPLAEA
jgi:flavin reductase (DIM6/NTAB) family NADH-FMN oxidoreductase RutF